MSKDVQHPGTTYPTLGRDFDNAGFVGNLPPGQITPIPPNLRSKLDWDTSRPVTMPGSYQAPAAAFTYSFLSFPVCGPNKIWEIMRYGVTAPDPFTVLAGVSVLAFRATFVPQDSNTEPQTFGDLLAVLGSVPNTSYPATRSTLIRGMERIVLAFKGLANNQQIQASIDVVEHDLQAYLLSLKSV